MKSSLFTRSGKHLQEKMYPKVKVREEIEEADQYDYERSSLQSLKAFEWISLDHYSSDRSQESVVRIPGSSLPNSPTPPQASKEELKKNKRALKGGSNENVRATSVPRLRSRAVLSSPDRGDRLNGLKTQTRRELLSPLKSHNACLNRHTRCMISSEDTEILTQRVHNKHPTESKKNIRAKGRPLPTDEKQHQKKDNHDAHCC